MQPKGRPMTNSLAILLLLSFLGGMTAPANANNSNVEFALRNYGGGNLSVFHQALISTGVASELNENTEYTVFAPTNAAFSEIHPRVYPCFYSSQCRGEVAAVLRSHIIPYRENIVSLSQRGRSVPTIGNARGIYVEEAYKNEFTADGHKVLYRSEGDRVNLYTINGVIMDGRERAAFQAQPVANAPDSVTQRTVTVRRTSVTSPVNSPYYLVPGGYPAPDIVYYTDFDETMTRADELPQNITTQTTTTTRTQTTK